MTPVLLSNTLPNTSHRPLRGGGGETSTTLMLCKLRVTAVVSWIAGTSSSRYIQPTPCKLTTPFYTYSYRTAVSFWEASCCRISRSFRPRNETAAWNLSSLSPKTGLQVPKTGLQVISPKTGLQPYQSRKGCRVYSQKMTHTTRRRTNFPARFSRTTGGVKLNERRAMRASLTVERSRRRDLPYSKPPPFACVLLYLYIYMSPYIRSFGKNVGSEIHPAYVGSLCSSGMCCLTCFVYYIICGICGVFDC